VLRCAGLAEFSDEVVNRPDVQAAISKIDYSVYSDEEAQARGYTLLTTFLDITLTNGRAFSARADAAKGSASVPMTEDEVAAKFRDCARFARWPAERAEKIISLVLDLEKVNDIRALTSLLQAGC
jgi:2-methylcitrate dehydratase PrpD